MGMYLWLYLYICICIWQTTNCSNHLQQVTHSKEHLTRGKQSTVPHSQTDFCCLIIVMCIPIVNTSYFFHLKHNCNFKGNWICLTMDQWSVQKPLHNIACTHIFTKQNNYSLKSAAFLELRLNPVN